jgi:septum formation protein
MILQGHAHSDAQIVLASASPRRRDLLRLLGISFSVRAADVDETPRPGESPDVLTQRLARSKARAVSTRAGTSISSTHVPDISQPDVRPGCDEPCATPAGGESRPDCDVMPGDVVLAADTVVVLDDRILGKPANDAAAIEMLTALRGRHHRVMTGVALAVAGEIRWSGAVETTVWMRTYGDDDIDRYIRSGKPRDRAGAYGIQDADFRPVERIDGCLANVVGLPLCHVRQALTGLDPTRSWGPNWDSQGGDGDCRVCERALDV